MCRGSCSLIPGRGGFGDLPGDEIVVSPPSPIVEPLINRRFGCVHYTLCIFPELPKSISRHRVVGYCELLSPPSSRGGNKAGKKAWKLIFDYRKTQNYTVVAALSRKTRAIKLPIDESYNAFHDDNSMSLSK